MNAEPGRRAGNTEGGVGMRELAYCSIGDPLCWMEYQARACSSWDGSEPGDDMATHYQFEPNYLNRD